jgi:hypothetical protein
MTGRNQPFKEGRGTHLLYLLAGLLSWPVIAAAIYWADRFSNALSTTGPAQSGIGFWAATAWALPIAALIILSGWLQRSRF